MIAKGHASLEDLLLLFIYLEIGSMVGIYFKTNHMPVRFLIYVGITALTRHLIVVVQSEAAPDVGILILAGGTLVMALAVLVVRFASFIIPARARRTAKPRTTRKEPAARSQRPDPLQRVDPLRGEAALA